VLTLDTSGLYAILNRADRHHTACISARDADEGPYYVPVAILSELAYLIERDLGIPALSALLHDLSNGSYALECGEANMLRIDQLARRYANLPLGFADAAVISCAEAHGGRVISTDRRDFDIVAAEGRIRVLPEP
jgi:uncharacterized protein